MAVRFCEIMPNHYASPLFCHIISYAHKNRNSAIKAINTDHILRRAADSYYQGATASEHRWGHHHSPSQSSINH